MRKMGLEPDPWQAEVLQSDHPRLLRPANFPSPAPGSGRIVVTAGNGVRVGVINVIGRVFMTQLDDPFRVVLQQIEALASEASVVFVDFHAEATSEKVAMGWHLDGRVAAVVGTHTHVATADEQVLAGGTAYQTDVGMTGPHDSILGRRYDRVLAATLSFVPHYFEVATGDPRLHGALVEVDPQTGRALAIRRVAIDQHEAQRLLTESS